MLLIVSLKSNFIFGKSELFSRDSGTLVFPTLMRPQPILWLATNHAFKFARTDFRNLEVGIGLRFFRNGRKRATIMTARKALDVKEEYGGIHLFGNAFGAREYWGVLIEEVHPQMRIFGARSLVGNETNHTLPSLSLKAHDFTQSVVLRYAFCAVMFAHLDEEFVHCLALQWAIEFAKCRSGMEPKGKRRNPFPIAIVSEKDKHKIMGIQRTIYCLAIFKQHVAHHLFRLNGEQLKRFYTIVTKKMIEASLNLSQLLLRLLRERVLEIHAYHTTAILYNVVEHHVNKVGNEVKHSERQS